MDHMIAHVVPVLLVETLHLEYSGLVRRILPIVVTEPLKSVGCSVVQNVGCLETFSIYWIGYHLHVWSLTARLVVPTFFASPSTSDVF
jgi:hypothetical protein